MTKSRDLIDTGINDLETDIFGRQQPNAVSISTLNAVAASEEKSGSLMIRTKDGDEVSFSFESLQSFKASQQLSYQAQISQEQQDSSGELDQQSDTESTAAYSQQTSYQYYERSGISFSLKGELDEGELESIANLVGQVQDLADTFYNGDIDKAYEEALSLGFDDKELVGYALQLNRTTQTEVLKTYENIQHYNEGNSDNAKYGNVVSPVAQYLEKMMDTFANAENKLASSEDYNALIAGLINEMKDVQVPDLISAINRFRSFNQTLLDGLPQSLEASES